MSNDNSKLNDAIAEALALAQNSSGMNEACTCDWIIRPLLQAAGYRLNEIKPQAVDQGHIPDYTILPETELTWFVEAKAWGIELNDSHVRQALIYTFTCNKRWAVLTNGREWRLYDNKIDSDLPQKLVKSVRLTDVDDAIAFFHAIGPESMQNGGIQGYAQASRLEYALKRELETPNTKLISLIQKLLQNNYGIQNPSPEAIHSFLNRQNQMPTVVVQTSEGQQTPITTAIPYNYDASSHDIRIKEWTPAALLELRKRLRAKAGIALLDTAARKPGILITYQDLLSFSERSNSQTRSDLAHLTMTIRKCTGNATWPVEVIWSANNDNQCSYRMPNELAALWLETKNKI